MTVRYCIKPSDTQCNQNEMGPAIALYPVLTIKCEDTDRHGGNL
jgi:hypothetical protein